MNIWIRSKKRKVKSIFYERNMANIFVSVVKMSIFMLCFYKNGSNSKCILNIIDSFYQKLWIHFSHTFSTNLWRSIYLLFFNWFSDPEPALKSKLTIWKYITALNFRICVHTHYVLLYYILIFLHHRYSLNNKNESHFYSTEYSPYTKSHAENIIKHF